MEDSNEDVLGNLLEEFDLPTIMGRPTRQIEAKPISGTFIRFIEEGDLETLTPIARDRASPLQRIKYAHHGVARRIALGQSPGQISLETGYSPSYVSALQEDPTFRELLKFYSNQAEQIFVDVADRMKSLGLSALEELQTRIDDAPQEWSRAELRDLAESMLVKPMIAAAKANGVGMGTSGGSGVNISVKFVGAPAANSLPIVEGEIIPPEQEI